jgi:starch synthase
MNRLRILNVCAEFAPLAKSGGLADVTSGLMGYLAAQGHEVINLLPHYSVVDKKVSCESPALGPCTANIGEAVVEYTAHRIRDTAAYGDIYLLECPALYAGEIYGSGEREFHRFTLLCRAALELCHALDWSPDIVHCHDWHTALLAAMIRAARGTNSLVATSCTVLTIHNIGYQGIFPARLLAEAELERLRPILGIDGLAEADVNLLKAGIMTADALTTVSPTYAREICSAEHGMGLDGFLRSRSHRLQGILNGVDYARWNPATDAWIDTHYCRDEPAGKRDNKRALLDELHLNGNVQTPLLGMISRLVSHKGIDLLVEVLPELLRQRRLGCAILGTGETIYVAALRRLADEFPGQLTFVEAHDERLAHRILAGCDLLVVPSRYEPCGLTQLYALYYGTVPVVRKTGGLADTIRHFDPQTDLGNGSVFEHADAESLHRGLTTALHWYADSASWARLMANGMGADFSWDRQGPEYETLYRKLTSGL